MEKRKHRWTDQWQFWMAILTILGTGGGGIWTLSGNFSAIQTEMVHLKEQMIIINSDRKDLNAKVGKVFISCCSELNSPNLVTSKD